MVTDYWCELLSSSCIKPETVRWESVFFLQSVKQSNVRRSSYRVRLYSNIWDTLICSNQLALEENLIRNLRLFDLNNQNILPPCFIDDET